MTPTPPPVAPKCELCDFPRPPGCGLCGVPDDGAEFDVMLPDDKLLPDDEPVDEDEENDMECGITPDGLCQLAGTEWCDWHCKGNLR
jgi:hypothetical protein